MKTLPTNTIGLPEQRRQGAGSRVLLSGLIFFLAGIAFSALWLARSRPSQVASVPKAVQLSDASKAVLRHLNTPVEIRLYSILDATSVPGSVQAFAVRVEQLLAQYAQAAGDRVTIIRYDTLSASNAWAAQADGISAFNIDKGESCFLGIAVVCDGQKESLSHLAPEWEPALEPDLSRAIARAAEAKRAAQPSARADTATLDAVRRSIPNLDAVSLEQGTTVLRNAGLTQFVQAAQELETQVKDAQQRFIQAQGNQSEATQKAALEQLRKIQAEATDKLKQIALNSHAQIAALQQLKKTAP
jgi:hypothetical protein